MKDKFNNFNISFNSNQEKNICYKKIIEILPNITPTFLDDVSDFIVEMDRKLEGRFAEHIEDLLLITSIKYSASKNFINSKMTNLAHVEIGSLFGFSAILTDYAMKKANNTNKINNILIDPLEGYYGKNKDIVSNFEINEDQLRKNLNDSKVTNFKLFKKYSTDPKLLNQLKKYNIISLFIDGDHSYFGLLTDWNNFHQSVAIGGFIIIDNINDKSWPSVDVIKDKILDKIHGKFKIISNFNHSLVLQKIKNSTCILDSSVDIKLLDKIEKSVESIAFDRYKTIQIQKEIISKFNATDLDSKFCIGIPVFKDHSRLERTLLSLKPYQNIIDILIIDDSGNKKKYIKFFESFKAKYSFRVIYNKKNIGLGPTRNLMIKNTTAEFITFLDCGDQLNLSFFNFFLNTLRQEREFDLLNFTLARYFPNKETYIGQPSLKKYENQNKESIVSELLALRLSNQATARIYNTKLLKQKNIYFPNSNLFHEDLGFTYKVFLNASKIINSPHNFSYVYYMDPGPSLSRGSFSRKYLFDIISIWQDRIIYLKDCGLLEKYKQDLIDGIVTFIFLKIRSKKGLINKFRNFIIAHRRINEFIYLNFGCSLTYNLLSNSAKKRIGFRNTFIFYRIGVLRRCLNYLNQKKINPNRKR